MYFRHVSHLSADRIQLRHRAHHFLIEVRVEFPALESGAVDTNAQALGQDNLVSGARRVVAAVSRRLGPCRNRSNTGDADQYGKKPFEAILGIITAENSAP